MNTKTIKRRLEHTILPTSVVVNDIILQLEFGMDKAKSFLIVKRLDISGIVPPLLQVICSLRTLQYYTRCEVSSFLKGHETFQTNNDEANTISFKH